MACPAKKIRVISNKVELDETVESVFPALLALAEVEDSYTLRPRAVIYENEVFERLKTMGISLGDVSKDETDYRARLREAKDADEKQLCIGMIAVKRLAVTASKNLDDVWREVTK